MQLCSHPILVSVDEIEKVEFVSARDKTQELSISPSQYIEVKPIISIIVYQRKDTMTLHVSTMVQNVLVPVVTIIEQEGTLVQIGQEASHAPTPQAQGGVETKEKENIRTRHLVLSMKLEEVIAIVTLVTLSNAATPTPSHALHRSSTKATSLQASRPNPSTSKVDEVACNGDINIDDVNEFPNLILHQ